MSYCVYKHTCPNGKVYVGITGKNPIERWGKNGENYKHQIFYRAILKYGWENIKHEILYSDLTKEEACEKEIELIALYKSNNFDYGYNLSSGGDSGFTGCNMKEETKRKISESLTGRHLSEETRKKISENNAKNNLGKPSIRAKKVMCMETHEVFPNLVLACEFANSKHVRCVCKGKRKTAGGYHWEYVDE